MSINKTLKSSVKNMRERVASIFSVGEELDLDDFKPEAKVDIALVGVEHAGKSTFFKQITSLYTPEEFRLLVLSDGRSQAIGRLLKTTRTLLKPVCDELETPEAREAGEELLTALTMFDLDEKRAKALKCVWSDPVFLEAYKSSPFFQPIDFLADVANCESLLSDTYAVPKTLHLKLHNSTHGYNYSKFTFDSAVPVRDDKAEVNSQGILSVKDREQEAERKLSKNSGNKQPSTNNLAEVNVASTKTKRNSKNLKASSNGEGSDFGIRRKPVSRRKHRPSIAIYAGGVAQRTTRTFRSLKSTVRSRRPTLVEPEVKMQPRKNEVRIWDVGGLYEKRTDWEFFLRKANVALFFVSLADYSTMTDDGSDENLFQDSLDMFKVLCESDFLQERIIRVVFTKLDVFQQKLVRFRIPFNVTGLFPDAPSGNDEFSLECNLRYARSLFLKVLETKHSFLNEDNIVFSALNTFDENAVKDVFVKACHEIEPQVKQQSSRGSAADTLLLQLNKVAKKKRTKSRKLRSFNVLKMRSSVTTSKKKLVTNVNSSKRIKSSRVKSNRVSGGRVKSNRVSGLRASKKYQRSPAPY